MTNSTSKKLSQDVAVGDHITFMDEEGYLVVIWAGNSDDGYPAFTVRYEGDLDTHGRATLVFDRDVPITVVN